MKIISFYNCKGGVSKSTLTILSGLYLSKNKKILLVDVDPQKSITNSLLTIKAEKTLLDFLVNDAEINNCIYSIHSNLDLLPSSIQLDIIQSLFTKFQKVLRTLNYDYIFIDCPPYQSALVTNSILASDMVAIPSCLSLMDFESLTYAIKRIRELDDKKKLSIILSRVGKEPTKEEGDYLQTINTTNIKVTRFPNNSIIRKLIDKQDDFYLKKYDKIRDSIKKVLDVIL